jgi:hypothetical protein
MGGILSGSSNNTDPGGPTYSFVSSNPNVARVNGSTITCIAPGSFYYTIYAQPTANFYLSSPVYTPTIYVSVVPEVIIFNNPKTWPPNAGVTGEVGMAICIPSGNYPYGFSNYSALTITNVTTNGNTRTFNATSTPTYNSVLNKYMVFVEPSTSGPFLNGLANTTSISNIGCLAVDAIATGMSTGQKLNFSFSGNMYSSLSCTDPFSFNWDPTSLNLDLAQGWAFGSFYSYTTNITPSQNLPFGTGATMYMSPYNNTCITGYYITPWAGYVAGGTTTGIQEQTNQGFTPIQQAWGVWTNISYGDQFGSTLTLDNVNYYYVGIPQIVNPVTYIP